MDAYSKDLRERVVGACEGHEMTQREVAEAFGVSVSFITKLLRRKRQTGSIAAKPRGGGRKPILASGHQTQVRKLVQQQSDATLAEYCQRLAERHGPLVSPATMCRVLARLGLVRKKRACMPQSVTRRGFENCGGHLPGRWRGFRLTSS
jgi:transposase